jgi:hypothetical protein
MRTRQSQCPPAPRRSCDGYQRFRRRWRSFDRCGRVAGADGAPAHDWISSRASAATRLFDDDCITARATAIGIGSVGWSCAAPCASWANPQPRGCRTFVLASARAEDRWADPQPDFPSRDGHGPWSGRCLSTACPRADRPAGRCVRVAWAFSSSPSRPHPRAAQGAAALDPIRGPGPATASPPWLGSPDQASTGAAG